MRAPLQPRAYCYDATGKKQHSLAVRRFYSAVLKALPEFVKARPVYFNPGGIAVWGETHLYLYPIHGCGLSTGVEAFDTVDGILLRQWNGRNSGHNHYAKTLE